VNLCNANEQLTVYTTTQCAVAVNRVINCLTACLEAIENLDEELLFVNYSGKQTAGFYVAANDLCSGLCNTPSLLHDCAHYRLGPWLCVDLTTRIMEEKVKFFKEAAMRNF
jgi:hypothetical protein